MIPGGSLWFFVVLGGSCWFLGVLGGSWWLLVVFGVFSCCYWLLLIALGGS